MEETKFSDLVAYFKALSLDHVELKGFYRFELDEVLTDMRDIKTPCLILEGYKFRFIDAKSDNPLKVRSGAFILIDKLEDQGNYDKLHELWDKLEVTGDDLIARIKADRRDPSSPIKNIDLESVDGSLISNEFNNYNGIRYTWDVTCQFDATVKFDKWISLAPVPES
jgi:hypothetical protein